ncbi:MAG: LptE family protein [Elusimicrobia bacterium]|nr:LptE family protein [Elusimicrobiota bacterium]
MKKAILLLAAAWTFAACASSPDMSYRPAAQILPAHIKTLAIRNVKNRTHQFGLEDKFTRRLIDEFLRDGNYTVVPESDAAGVVVVTINRYILTPTQYDAVLTPIAYKLQVVTDLEFVDRTANVRLFDERNLEGVHLFSASTVRGGKTEEQAREFIWEQLARDIRKRVVEGFGSVTGSSLRGVSSQPPPNQPEPALPPKPVNPNPY